MGGAGRHRKEGRPLLAATVALPPRKTPELASHVATDAHAHPNDLAALWIRGRSSEHRARASTGEIDATTLKKRHWRQN